MSQTQTPAQFVPGQTVTVKAPGSPVVRYAMVSKVRWSRSGQEYRYLLRVLCGDHTHRLPEVPEKLLRLPRTIGEPTHLDTEHAHLGTLEHIELDGQDMEGIRMPDGTMVYLP